VHHCKLSTITRTLLSSLLKRLRAPTDQVPPTVAQSAPAIHNSNNNTHLTAFGTTRVSRYQKDKTNLDLLEQEIVSDNGISWAIYKSAPQADNHASTPSLSFLQAGCPSCCPTNSIKALTEYICAGDYISTEYYQYNLTKVTLLPPLF